MVIIHRVWSSSVLAELYVYTPTDPKYIYIYIDFTFITVMLLVSSLGSVGADDVERLSGSRRPSLSSPFRQ